MDDSGGLQKTMLEPIKKQILAKLGEEALQLPLEDNAELALDWFNGRRTPNANPYVKGALINLNLGSDAPRVYRALVESTCFGAKQIIEHFEQNNVRLKGIIALGGVAKKSSYVPIYRKLCQQWVKVLRRPISRNPADFPYTRTDLISIRSWAVLLKNEK
jgi:L-ribulokinase